MPFSTARFLVANGISLGQREDSIPNVSSFLESTPGAYTTTRTNGNATLLLFWDRHLRRLADSARILAQSPPGSPVRSVPRPSSPLAPLLGPSLREGLRLALDSRKTRESLGLELAITALVNGSDAYVHVSPYELPDPAAGARLAVVGRGRDLARAKYSEWARIRKGMEKRKPPTATEALLSNDGDRILEGSVTNFFVVCRKPRGTPYGLNLREVQTAPISDGVLPGVLRQLVIEVCCNIGIPVREVAPSWLERELWEEAFVTNSLRILQHVEIIQAPLSWGDLHSGSWKDIRWVEKRFKDAGVLTIEIQKHLLERARTDGYPVSYFI